MPTRQQRQKKRKLEPPRPPPPPPPLDQDVSSDSGSSDTVTSNRYKTGITMQMAEVVRELRRKGASRMFILHFFSHKKEEDPDPSQQVQEERDNCHYCQLRSWESETLYPITILNDVEGDNTCLDPSFRFIEKNVVSENIHFADEEFLSGCDCQDDLQCQKEGCECLQDLEFPDDEKGKHINPYHAFGRRTGCLRKWMLESRKPIYECHDQCKCSEKCASRVVGEGRKVSLQVFRTSDGRGWGLRATEDIRRGQFVGKYVGELLTPDEAQERRRASKAANKKDIYLFALDKFVDPESPDPRLHQAYEIDGEFMSGPTRFINHSCDPNLRIFAVVNDHANKPFHDLCFFALRDIDRFEELTFDYLDGVDGEKPQEDRGRPRRSKANNDEDELTKTRCLCGAKGCRKFLWT